MGGRGRDSGHTGRQLTMEEHEKRMAINEAIQESVIQRAAINDEDGSDGIPCPTLYKKCACCGEYSISMESRYEVCPVCRWIDDPNQNQNPENLNGKNPISLLHAREKYVRQQEEKDS